MYIIINPFTNKPIQFSTFKDEDFNITNKNSDNTFETRKALCIEQEHDLSLLEKTYNPTTNQFE